MLFRLNGTPECHAPELGRELQDARFEVGVQCAHSAVWSVWSLPTSSQVGLESRLVFGCLGNVTNVPESNSPVKVLTSHDDEESLRTRS
jgi:hypothetical protein